MPDPDKLVAFDRNRRIMVSMAENVARATRPQLQELVQLLVQRVQAKERVINPASVEWTPPARPFFGEVRCYGAPGRVWGSHYNSLPRADGDLRLVPMNGSCGRIPALRPTNRAEVFAACE